MEGEIKFSRYKILNEIGKGSFSTVYKAIDLEKKSNGAKEKECFVAIKVVDMTESNEKTENLTSKPSNDNSKTDIIIKKKQLLREIEISKNVHHPNIVTCYNVFNEENDLSKNETTSTNNIYYLIMEYFPNGSFLDYFKKSGRCLTEQEACYFFKQMVSAVSYLHKKNIIHRDIKFENFVILDAGIIKLIDFGFSIQLSLNSANDDSLQEYEIVNQNDHLRGTFCGSLAYSSPEIILHSRYTYSIDIWSLGIVLFGMIFGTLPFQGQGEVLINEILTSSIYFPKPISNELKDLISSMLRKNPKHRLTIEQVEKHEWMLQFGSISNPILNNYGTTKNIIFNNSLNDDVKTKANDDLDNDNDVFHFNDNSNDFMLNSDVSNSKPNNNRKTNIFLNGNTMLAPVGNNVHNVSINSSVSHQNLPQYISTHLPQSNINDDSKSFSKFDSNTSTNQKIQSITSSELALNPFLILDQSQTNQNNESHTKKDISQSKSNFGILHSQTSKASLNNFTTNDKDQDNKRISSNKSSSILFHKNDNSSNISLPENVGDNTNKFKTNNIFLSKQNSPSNENLKVSARFLVGTKNKNENVKAKPLSLFNDSKSKNPFIIQDDSPFIINDQNVQTPNPAANQDKKFSKSQQINISKILTFQ